MDNFCTSTFFESWQMYLRAGGETGNEDRTGKEEYLRHLPGHLKKRPREDTSEGPCKRKRLISLEFKKFLSFRKLTTYNKYAVATTHPLTKPFNHCRV